MRRGTRRGARGLRRGIQALSMGLFFWLLWRTALPLSLFPPVDSFLRLDPLVGLAVPLAAREWIPTLMPGAFVLAATLAVGRLFCGYICPMGATLDAAHVIGRRLTGVRPPQADGPLAPWRRVKYLLLAGTIGAALIGVNLAFWTAPIPLVTRFYALLLHPLLTLAGHAGLEAGQPVLGVLDMPALSYLQIPVRRFAGLYFLLAWFGLLFWLERLRPRFWCRYLCPAGALLGLFSRLPAWRRRVRACAACGQCARQCPAAAIADDGGAAAHSECLACRTCTDVCPVAGLAFSARPVADTSCGQGRLPAAPAAQTPFLPSRRALLAAAASGLGLAAVDVSGVSSLLRASKDETDGLLWPAACIRPPGALPEAAFLARCVRCGQCMKVCPSNGLQPAWLAAGPDGLFSPVLTARRGPCEPDCHACGRVCPTQAVRSLPLAEKQWAKIGTAVVLPGRCLAWAEDKACVVCQEVCPYGAVDLLQRAGRMAAAPVVAAARCYGCGFCEQHCPVRLPAIVIEPLQAMRRTDGAYRRAGQEAGLDLEPGRVRLHPGQKALSGEELPPGFTP